MTRVLKFALRLILIALGAVLVLWGAAFWASSHPGAEVSLQSRQQSFQRARHWVLSHEAGLLSEGNAALWWMLRVTAERTHDQALSQLVQRYLQVTYTGPLAKSPWRRLIVPGAVFEASAEQESLAPYQSFFYHAVTCKEVISPNGMSSSAFLRGNACRPMLSKVWLSDRVCSTHQMMGLRLFRQSGCRTEHDIAKVEASLLGDIRLQLRLSPIVEDAYIQRVLVLKWFDPDHGINSVWLQRIIDAQQVDGGWKGSQQLPELPQWAQPWRLKMALRQVFGRPSDEAAGSSDFHASAQGLLLLALSLQD